MQTALLSAKGLSTSFGALRVLHEVDFDVRPGEVLGILGPNGVGKTTQFNLITGDLRTDSSRLTFGDVTPKAQPPFRRCQFGIGRTYQIPKPYSGMITFENLLIAAVSATSGLKLTAMPFAPPCCATANCWTRPTSRRAR